MGKLLLSFLSLEVGVLLLDYQTSLAAEKTVETVVNVGDVSLVYSLIEASKISAKIEEYGVGAVLTLSGGLTSYAMGRTLMSAYRETRAFASEAVGKVLNYVVGAGAVGATAGAISEAVKGVGKGVGAGAKKLGSKVAGKFRKVSPDSVKTPFDGFSPLSTGGVGAGRTVSATDLLEGKVGSSTVSKLSTSSGELTRKGNKWFDAKGNEVSDDFLKDFLSSSTHVKAELEDGTTSYLTKSGDVFRERVGTDVLSSPDKLQHRLSRDEVVLDAKKLSPDKITEVVNSLPEGARISLVGNTTTDKEGKLKYHRIAFKKTEKGLKLYNSFGEGKRESIQKMFQELNSDKRFQTKKRVDKEFFQDLFDTLESEDVD